VNVLDSNVFLRFLTGDDPAKARASQLLFERLEAGEDEATTCEAVIAEVVYVLSSRKTYMLPHSEVSDRLKAVLQLRGLRLEHKQTYLQALDIYSDSTYLGFEDALLVAHMQREGWTELVSYDRHFDRLSGPTRVEP
jgi:predicted nucleic acid-binding protein